MGVTRVGSGELDHSLETLKRKRAILECEIAIMELEKRRRELSPGCDALNNSECVCNSRKRDNRFANSKIKQ